MTFSILISVYNEKDRILKVLEALENISLVSEIIIIDDGSNLESKKYLNIAKKRYPNFIFLEHTKNLGKTHAIKTGYLISKSDNIFTIDGDLIGLKKYHIENMINVFKENNLDMLIGERGDSLYFYFKTGMEACYTGERIISRNLLKKYSEIFDDKGYLFEAYLNKIVFRKYICKKYLLDGVKQKYKPQKNGIKGIFKDMKMLFLIFKQIGLKEFIWQTYFVNKMDRIK